MLFVRWDPEPSAARSKGLLPGLYGRTSGRFRAFVTHNCRKREKERARPGPSTSLHVLSWASFLPLRALYSRAARVHSDSPTCQRQRKLSQPLMVFERDRSDAKDVRTHAGQITILPLSRQTGYFRARRSSYATLPFPLSVYLYFSFNENKRRRMHNYS